MSRSAISVLSAFLLCLGVFSAPAQAPARSERPTDPIYHCAGSISVPLDVVLSIPDAGPMGAGLVTTVEARVTPRAAVQSIEINVNSDGAMVLGSDTAMMPAPAAGESGAMPIQIQYLNEDRAVVTVHVTAVSADGEQTWERTESFYTLFKDGRTLTGMGSFLQLEIQAIDDDYTSGKLTEDEARAATTAVATLPAETNQNPIPAVLRTAEEQAMVDALALRPAGMNAPKPPTGAGNCITIMGNVQWRDENNNLHPAYGLNAQIWDEDLVIDEFVDVAATDANGDYYIEVDGDDGLLQGDRDVYVKIVTKNSAVRVKPQGLFADAYETDSGVHGETPCGTTIVENFTFGNADPNPAVNLCEAASWIALYTRDNLNGGSFLSSIDFEWPGDTGSANYNGSRINMRPGDRWDWDVLHHEYGHYIQDVFNTEDNPGGPHNLGDCISDVQGSKSRGVRMAWGEGWPTYNGTVAQQLLNLASKNIPRVGDVNYADTGESNFSYSLEAQDNLGLGEDNELAVQRIFWDLFDGPADGRDNVTTSDQTLFNIVNGADPTTLSAAWAAIRATLSNSQQLSYGAITTDHFVGPSLIGPIAGATVSPSNANFSWNRRVGCSTTYDGDGFTLRFFNAATNAPILSLPVGNTTTRSLTLTELQTLIASSHNVKWAVEGSNSSNPATGPYLGENFQIVVNQPPVADAGDDVTAECMSTTTTPVMLDGTGSSDPDGDDLTYSWAPAGLFNDPTSSTPTGNFPLGATNVTLTVSDGLETDTDQVVVTIEDTTPPDVTCPADITVECNDHCVGGGVPKGDAQLTAFFAGFTATDRCDATLIESDDAPDCFPLGDTTVKYIACDSDGNCDSCTAVVTVVDTTPPEITVALLTADALWPPNHKMSPVATMVTVTDLCDPNPTFVLTSVTSNEPDNGLGDGDTANDIQEADLGTPDEAFQLRAERAGGGNGRKYTIIYTAMDQSGNTAADTTCITVPHDQSGHALASSGFNSDGTGFLTDALQYRLIVLSRPGFDVTDIDMGNVFVGNLLGVTRPVESRFVDLNGDRQSDLELLFDVRDTQRIRSMSTKKEGIGLHFHADSDSWFEDGESWLVKNIFTLGPPLIVVDDSPADKNTLTPEMPDTDEPGESDGLVVTTDSGRLHFTTSAAGPVRVEVFNITGRKIRTIVNGDLSAGSHDLNWDGMDDGGRRLPSGIYFYRIQMPDRQEVVKVRMVR